MKTHKLLQRDQTAESSAYHLGFIDSTRSIDSYIASSLHIHVSSVDID